MISHHGVKLQFRIVIKTPFVRSSTSTQMDINTGKRSNENCFMVDSLIFRTFGPCNWSFEIIIESNEVLEDLSR